MKAKCARTSATCQQRMVCECRKKKKIERESKKERELNTWSLETEVTCEFTEEKRLFAEAEGKHTCLNFVHSHLLAILFNENDVMKRPEINAESVNLINMIKYLI